MLNGKLSLASAVFHTEKTNLRVPDPAMPRVNVLDGTVTRRGFEASAAGKITDAVAGHRELHLRAMPASPRPPIAAQLNTEPLNTPTHAFSLWTTYESRRNCRSAAARSTTARSLRPTLPTRRWSRLVAVRRDGGLQDHAEDRRCSSTSTTSPTSSTTRRPTRNWVVPAPSRIAALTLRVRTDAARGAHLPHPASDARRGLAVRASAACS